MNLPSAAVGYYTQWWAATSTMIPVSWGAGYFYSFCPLPELHAALQWHLVTWWHLYLSIILFPPLVLRSLKVTSVWLQLQTSPMYFIAELYIWTPLISPVLRPPARLTPSMLYSWLIPSPPPTLFTAAIPTSSLSNRISPYWPAEETLGYRFHFIQIKYCTKSNIH